MTTTESILRTGKCSAEVRSSERTIMGPVMVPCPFKVKDAGLCGIHLRQRTSRNVAVLRPASLQDAFDLQIPLVGAVGAWAELDGFILRVGWGRHQAFTATVRRPEDVRTVLGAFVHGAWSALDPERAPLKEDA